MDFGTLLHVAKKNNESKQKEGKFYSTKFAPPKKEAKKDRLSENIQKFLHRREQEERERQREEREKVANLLAKRDEKSKNKIKKMLKVTKSANKSVLDDAINSDHTAITVEGPDQPDQDDYGYVSTEANAFYQQYIEKVKDVKEDKGFSLNRTQYVKDLSGTKERVKAAITKDAEQKKSSVRVRSNSGAVNVASTVAKEPAGAPIRAYSTTKTLYDPEEERRQEDRKRREEVQKKAKLRKPPPPPMDFQALLKLAERKQFEPIEVAPIVKKSKEPERLLTSKEKREIEERQRAKEVQRSGDATKDGGGNKDARDRDERNAKKSIVEERATKLVKSQKPLPPKSTAALSASPALNNSVNGKAIAATASNSIRMNSSYSGGTNNAVTANLKAMKPPAPPPPSEKTSSGVFKNMSLNSSHAKKKPDIDMATKNTTAAMKPSRQLPSQDARKDGRSLPSSDARRSATNKTMNDARKLPLTNKRRIIDDDEDYDSELDDFIDDGDCDEDYSTHIKAIFGYDKSKYRYVDDEDDTGMESNFAQVQREEFISKKIGLQEDLEDMRLEALEKKRKMSVKKRKTDN